MSIKNLPNNREFFFVNRELFCQSSWSAGVFVPKYDHMGQHMALKKMADCKGVLCTGQQPFPKSKVAGALKYQYWNNVCTAAYCCCIVMEF